MHIDHATGAAALDRLHPVMAELRPHLDLAGFREQVERQAARGYRLAFVEDAGEIVAVAGYRLVETLAWGRTLYVDDLVTRGEDRSRGHGSALFDWLVARAREAGCRALHLDSGVQRFGAHRFYLGKRMRISSHHFALDLD